MLITFEKIVVRILVILILLLISFNLFAEEKRAINDEVRWLGWPVTASAYKGIDPGIFVNPVFNTDISDDIEIGLRPDGTVVWRYVNKTTMLKEKKTQDKIDALSKEIDSLVVKYLESMDSKGDVNLKAKIDSLNKEYLMLIK